MADEKEEAITKEELAMVNEIAAAASDRFGRELRDESNFWGTSIMIWRDDRGFCMRPYEDEAIYVYQTEKELFKAVKKEFQERTK